MSEVLGQDTDAGILDAPTIEYVNVKKPIRMTGRKTFTPINVRVGDSIKFTFRPPGAMLSVTYGAISWWRRLLGQRGERQEQLIPRKEQVFEPVPFKRAMAVDTFVRIEVIDEFGLDVGVGCLIGESKK